MKKFNTVFLFMLFTCAAFLSNAQNDTLLHQDFQLELFEGIDFALFPDSPDTDSMWVNWDEDGITDANTRPGNWYQTLEFYQSTLDTILAADSNFVGGSSSWLQNFDTTSSNWLITPLLYIGDDQATLHWRSAPRQGPRYMDGYAVKILTGNSDPNSAGTTVTTVFRAAEMVDFAAGTNGQSLDPADFIMGPGYVHANNWTDTAYILVADVGETSNSGILEPHSVSLADWAGEWVHIAFHHDSSDDNYMELDDILLLGNIISSTAQVKNDIRFVTFPNPVNNFLNVLFRTQEPAAISLELFNQNGQQVAVRPIAGNMAGEFNEKFDLRNLPAGAYSVVLTIDGQRFAKTVVRK